MRYWIGIDLGTTNSAVAYKDTSKPHQTIEFFKIPQFTSFGKLDFLPMLPSFCYLSEEEEWPKGSFKLPWKEEDRSIVGQFAKIQGARLPTRLVQSAKSWLCNVASNRQDKILPVAAADASKRISPVEASARYLAHLKEAWNHAIAKNDPEKAFEEQEIILTVPASFDEAARALTVEAAKKAGLHHFTLLEEPQAAFYSWIAQHEKNWQEFFQAGNAILVCDVGGGTTDFSLIEVHEKEGQLSFQRMSVGDHLLLGGDNIDLAIAHLLEKKLQERGNSQLESTQWLQLLAEARQAKEHLLQPEISDEEAFTIVLQGAGSSVVKGSLSVPLQAQELRDFLLNGFFSPLNFSEALQLRKSRGMRTLGLPYEDEPSIIKHMAFFLKQAGYGPDEKQVTHLLLNGGTLKAALFQEALLASLKKWFQKAPTLLQSSTLDLAVARGAAYYSGVRKGVGQSIGGGLPRTYYLKIDVRDSSDELIKKGLTLLPRGSEEGKEFHPHPIFSLRTNTPVTFSLMTSHVRLNDNEGDVILLDDQEIQELPPIQTILRYGKQGSEQLIPVKLGIRLNPIGTLDLWLESQASSHRWNLEFQLRSIAGQDHNFLTEEKSRQDETFAEGYLEPAKEMLIDGFDPLSALKPSQWMEKLEEKMGIQRKDWPLSILRALFDTLIKLAPRRKISSEHEARWWNLAGYLLRPGYGFPLDDFRIKELWKIILGDLKSAASQEVQIQRLICYRRVAGGLNKGQQMQLASDLSGSLFDKKTSRLVVIRKGERYFFSERIRSFAALERIETPLKVKLGEVLLDKILKNEGDAHDYWALGRLAARHLWHASSAQVISKETCAKWVAALLEVKHMDHPHALFAFKQMAKKTDHRELNLPDELVKKLALLYPELMDTLYEDLPLSREDQEQLFGENLPSGLILEQN